MLNSIPVSLVLGLVFGFLAGLGIGGGSLLIMWLTLILQMQLQEARAINLVFFIAAAGTITLFRWKKGRFDPKVILPAVISGCVAAVVFTWIGSKLELTILRKIFGILLLATGIRELFYRPRKAR